MLTGSVSPPTPPSADTLGRSLPWLAAAFVVSLILVFTLRLYFESAAAELRTAEINERARLALGEEIVFVISGVEKSLYRMAAAANPAAYGRERRRLDEQIDHLVNTINVLKNGGAIKRRLALNLEGTDEMVTEIRYRAPEGALAMESIEIWPLIDQLRGRFLIDQERLLHERWRAADAGRFARFFEIENEIGLLLKQVAPVFYRLEENSNRLFFDNTRRMEEIEAAHEARYRTLKLTETAAILLIVALGGAVGHSYTRRLSLALERARTAQDEIERQRSEIATMLDTLSDGVYATDLNGNIVFMNTAALDMLGFQADELIGQTVHEAIHHTRPDGTNFPREACPLIAVLRDGAELEGEEYFVARDGHFVPVAYRSRPLMLDGQIAGSLLSFQDITARREAEARIRLQQAGLDAAANMIVITDARGKIEYVNPAFCRTTGYTTEEVIGQSSSLLKSETHDAAFYRDMWGKLTRGEAWDGELVNRRKNGEFYDEQMSITPIIENGRIMHYIAIKRDIGQEAETRRRLLLLEAAMRETDQVIMIVDTDAHEGGPTIRYVNPAFERVTGYAPEQAIGRRTGILRGPDTDPAKVAALVTALTRSERIVLEMNYRRADGTPYIVELQYAPVPDDRGKVRHFIATISDISARKEFETRLAEARDRALKNAHLKTEFLSTMSHEIRTPMNGIIGMTDLLLDTALDVEQRELATVVRESGHALLTIINDILDFSKIEAGKLTIEETDFSISHVVEGVIDLLAAKTQEKQLVLSGTVAPDLPPMLRGDPTRLRQVLLNLVGNAIKFTERGSVSIRVERDPVAPDTRLRLQVSDTGIGITQEAMSRLFQSFSQADSSTTRKYGGTGLGLAISKRLVELMGGQIGAESRPGEGSVFWFALPLVAGRQEMWAQQPEMVGFTPHDESARATGINATPAIGLRDALEHGRLILLAEDNPTNRRLAQLMLTKLGFAVHCVENGYDAVDAAAALPYAAILMDCQMPVMDGFEATTEIRRHELNGDRHIPVIAMTANAMQGDRERCLAAGMDDYISKPVKIETLSEVLGRWLPIYQLPEDTPSAKPGRPAIDWASLQDLLGEDQDGIRELLAVFIENVEQVATRIEAGIAAGDVASIRAAAHELKGVAGNMGAIPLAECAVAIENAAIDNDGTKLAASLPALSAAFATLREAVLENPAS